MMMNKLFTAGCRLIVQEAVGKKRLCARHTERYPLAETHQKKEERRKRWRDKIEENMVTGPG